ncbi:sensor histidine kinase [Microtetraspora malaysiensis]|uniref:sensor histidine kinase n=1 Tax=Microtetraspora malaysiensis TaxID=161358 RepID=UPI003D926A88
MRARLMSLLLRPTRLPILWGVIVSALFVAAETFLTDPLERWAPGSSLGVVYLLGVLVVSYLWGLRLGVVTAVVSGFAFDYFHLPPEYTITLFSSWSWIALIIFIVVALLAGWAAALMRSLVVEADNRRREADTDAKMSRLLLRTERVRSALPAASQRLAKGLGLPFLTIEVDAVPGDGERTALPLVEGTTRLGTLLVPDGLPDTTMRRLRERVVPSLEALLHAARDREAISEALETSRDQLRRIAEVQAALRRVATLVARGVPPTDILDAVACETGLLLRADYTVIERYEPDDTIALVSWWSKEGAATSMPPVGSRWPVREHSVAGLVRRTRRPGRMTRHEAPTGELADWARAQRIVSTVGSPIVVEARLWGVMISLFRAPEPSSPADEEHMLEFTELIATAISNAQARDELAASRARVVAASDETRHRIERDLHDGAQQRLVSLGLELRTMESGVPEELADLRQRLSSAVDGLTLVLEDLRELSRGIHPAILSKGGLGPALKMLARRSPVPVELDVRADRRLPERVEVAAYYVVSEALTNVAKHAQASMARVEVDVDDARVTISVRDDGVGGADTRVGSGLIGLSDRVQALDGTLEIASPAGQGTTLTATIPLGTG